MKPEKNGTTQNERLEMIDRLCRERGWTHNRLATEAGMSEATLRHLFKHNYEPRIDMLERICDGFRIPMNRFFKRIEDARADTPAHQEGADLLMGFVPGAEISPAITSNNAS